MRATAMACWRIVCRFRGFTKPIGSECVYSKRKFAPKSEQCTHKERATRPEHPGNTATDEEVEDVLDDVFGDEP